MNGIEALHHCEQILDSLQYQHQSSLKMLMSVCPVNLESLSHTELHFFRTQSRLSPSTTAIHQATVELRRSWMPLHHTEAPYAGNDMPSNSI